MKVIAKENIPTRRQIKYRFDKRLARLSKLFNPITELLAEESEKIIHETWLMPEPEIMEHKIYLSRNSMKGAKRYYCPFCQKQNIYYPYNYCPSCGTEIEWRSMQINQLKAS
jgi:hypothetical protein